MAKVIQRRRGTTAQHASFTGLAGELTVDTDKKTVVVHDGSTAGGVPLAKAADVPVLPADPNADRILFWDDSAGAWTSLTLTDNLVISGTQLRAIETHGVALSDETTAITTGTNKATMSLPYAFTVTAVYATLNTVSSSGVPTVDINEGGTTILSTKLTIDASEKTSATAAAAAVISDASIAANAEIGFDIDVAGTGAKGLKVFIQGYRT